MIIIDSNGAIASVTFRTSEVIAIYPITPSFMMVEQADVWAGNGLKNAWGDTPRVVEMQSKTGATAIVHGVSQTGVLLTSFMSPQGLPPMIPTLYKLAGELTPFVLHVVARTVATHVSSIFGDHPDVMAVCQTGYAMLCAASIQEAQDFALILRITALKSCVPFIHFFDGFRTLHEINKTVPLVDDVILELVPQAEIDAHHARALNPKHPVTRSTPANPDAHFQSREATSPWYNAVYDCVKQAMNDSAAVTGRHYQPFEYYGHPQAERVIVLMDSVIGTCEGAVDELLTRGEKAGVSKVRLYRPSSVKHSLQALPGSVRSVAVLGRTKGPGIQAKPLRLNVMAALTEAFDNGEREIPPHIINGRCGLSSKKFGPGCVLTVFAELDVAKPKARFTAGIYDDATDLSPPPPESTLLNSAKLEALFYGLGSDGGVSATRNNIKIIGSSASWYAQGYFVYDSKETGGLMVSHPRMSERPIRSAYLISQTDFVGCCQLQFTDRYQIVERLKPGSVFLLNTPYNATEVWSRLPQEIQTVLNQKKVRLYVTNAAKIARECGPVVRISVVIQMAFFYLTQILPGDSVLAELQGAIAKGCNSRGQDLVERNWQTLVLARESVEEVPLQPVNPHGADRLPVVSDAIPDFMKTVTVAMLVGFDDALSVSALLPDGTWPMGTTHWERCNITEEILIWKEESCIQCNHCAAACPHPVIRAGVVPPEVMEDAPASLYSLDVKSCDMRGQRYVLRAVPEDCTGCNLCIEACPMKDRQNPEIKAINMMPRLEHVEKEKANYDFFLSLSEIDHSKLERIDIRTPQLTIPLLEYSDACSGCGETLYIKLLAQLYGGRMLIANATGCSLVYSGNLPSTPYAADANGCGSAWVNSLFEDGAEFDLGFRLTVDQRRAHVLRLLDRFTDRIPTELLTVLKSDTVPEARRAQVAALRRQLSDAAEAHELLRDADVLVEKSVQLIGGDDQVRGIGFGGLDHILSLTGNVNVLVPDTQYYSNTGGQTSKATPLGAVTELNEYDRHKVRKDLGVNMMMYGHVYTTQISLGAQLNQTARAIQETEAYPGPSLIIVYSPCGEHGYDLALSHDQMCQLTATDFWSSYCSGPRCANEGKLPLVLDSHPPSEILEETLLHEQCFRRLNPRQPEVAEQLWRDTAADLQKRYDFPVQMAGKAEKSNTD